MSATDTGEAAADRLAPTPSSGPELAGRTAIVTGASRNIGRAIAEALAAGGASVVVNYKDAGDRAADTVRAIEARGGRALAIAADVTDRAAVDRMVEAAAAAFGPPTILVNNASIRQEWPFETLSFADWRAILDPILDGAFHVSQAVIPHMLAAGGGAIVNIGGETGHSGARERAHVVAAKAGLAGFTKALALEFADRAITVNTVVPGAMDTADSHMVRHPGSTFKAKRMPPVGRRGAPWEVAAMVRHLAGPAGRYVTGQSIHLNGGHYLP
ncbi:SDR family NAD(P)-dependent oxidoreductase [Acuticoccus kandeliae]|uniref:SDR family NAD(P)-dependent oxidoreductase n=1 Tax=Acuticoccus kandeliae TaxID=2073160 RepID=UPI000D3EC078|nr:SDR family oxidoreductase [Acuticoccus kandeliae]